MRARLVLVPLVLGFAALAGCGADGILPEDPAAGQGVGKPLTEAEAWSAVYNQPIVQHPPYYPPPGQPTGRRVVTTTEPCRSGGERTERLESSGTLAPEGYLVSRYAKEITSRACAYPIWRDGPVITVTSTPLQKVDFTLNVPVAGDGAFTDRMHGRFDWSMEGRSGSCEYDFAHTRAGGTGVVELRGSVCGYVVDRTFPPPPAR